MAETDRRTAHNVRGPRLLSLHVRWHMACDVWVVMNILKTWIREIGFVAVLVGVLAFPVGIGINPKEILASFIILVSCAFRGVRICRDYRRILLIVISLLLSSRIGDEG